MSNFVQEGYKAAGRTVGRPIGGEKGAQVGEKIGSGVFVAVDVALSFVSGKAILDGAKAAKEGTTFFKGTQEVLKATTKNAATNVKSTFKAIKELPGKVKDTGSNVVKKFSSLFIKESKVATNTVQETKHLMPMDLQFFASSGDEAVTAGKEGKKVATVVDSGKKSSNLLPGEGSIGTYKELRDAGEVGDNITPHHMPSAEYMSSKGVSKNDGLCINMEMPSPGTGGRHRMTDTYGRNMTDAQKAYYYSLSPRDALAYDINNLRQIYMNEGLYSEMRPKLQTYIKTYKEYMPKLFEK